MYCKICKNTLLYRDSMCPYCYTIINKLREYMHDHRGVVSEVISKIINDYQKEISKIITNEGGKNE